MSVRFTAAILFCGIAAAQSYVPLFNGKDLDGWESVGDGIWTVMSDGALVGQRDLTNANHQAWLYTKKEFGNFDLHVEWWTRWGGNSGISIRDKTRGAFSVGDKWVADKTPSHNGYEIQIANGLKGDRYPSGSVYLFDTAKTGLQKDNDWNSFDIESRPDAIRVKLNGQLVSQYGGEKSRSLTGPIGLQLHDKNSIVMFRNIRIRELP